MMKKTILAIVFLGLFLSAGTCFAQVLADWEWKIYYDVVEKFHEILYEIPRGEVATNEDLEIIYKEVASDHDIGIGRVKNIDSKALGQEPTDREYEVYYEMMERYDALPEESEKEVYERVDKEIANNYGLTLVQIHEIEYRVADWDMWW